MTTIDRFHSKTTRHLRRSSVLVSAASSMFTALLAAFLLASLAVPANAQAITTTERTPSNTSDAGSEPQAPRSKTPPRKPFRSARLTYMDGDVRVQQASNSANSVAALNMPLVEGAILSAGPDGQAEVEFEDGSLARLTPNSGLSLVHLSVDSSGNYQTRIALLGGLAYLELRAGTKYLYTVEVGGDTLSPVENATVRVNFDEAPASVAVLDGTVHFATAGKSYMDATAGQTVQVDPSSEGSVLLVRSAIAPESWDLWNENRDEAAASEASMETDARKKFAGNQGYGWSDLDANGSWYDVPGHGEVWQPDVAANAGDALDDGATEGDPNAGDDSGFDPYGYGDWAWTPVGYAWASGYGWGWLPYRCGVWSFYPGFGWGWSPNPYCGAYGFGGYGYSGYADGGYGLNLGLTPVIYQRPHRPIVGVGPIEPILHGPGRKDPGRSGPVPLHPPHHIIADRVIAGTPARRLEPIAIGSSSPASNTIGAGLRRDFPVDAKTHTPVYGVQPPAAQPVIHTGSAPASYARRLPSFEGPGVTPTRGAYSPQPSVITPSPNNTIRPTQNTIRPAQNDARPAPAQRQSQPSASHYTPPPAPVSRPAAAPSAQATPTAPKGK